MFLFYNFGQCTTFIKQKNHHLREDDSLNILNGSVKNVQYKQSWSRSKCSFLFLIIYRDFILPLMEKSEKKRSRTQCFCDRYEFLFFIDKMIWRVFPECCRSTDCLAFAYLMASLFHVRLTAGALSLHPQKALRWRK